MREDERIIRMQQNNASQVQYSRDSTVRKEFVLPQRELAPQENPDEAEQNKKRIDERQQQWRADIRDSAVNAEIKRHFLAVNRFSRAEALTIIVAAALFLGACAYLLYQEAALGTAVRKFNNLQSEYLSVSDETHILQGKLEQQIDPDALYRYATEKLGMHYPKKSQIIQYHGPEIENVYQGEEIPQDDVQ